MRHQLLGHGLRKLREQSRLTLKEVEKKSRRIARKRRNAEYLITAGRLSQVEGSNSLPSLYKAASLSEIYQIPFVELLGIYGIKVAMEDATSGSNGTPVQTEEKHYQVVDT